MPFITNANGLYDTNFTFEFGAETSVLESCSLVFQNEFYVFGGDLESRTRDFRPGYGMNIRFSLSLTCLVTDNDNSCHCDACTMLVSDNSLLSFFN